MYQQQILSLSTPSVPSQEGYENEKKWRKLLSEPENITAAAKVEEKEEVTNNSVR